MLAGRGEMCEVWGNTVWPDVTQGRGILIGGVGETKMKSQMYANLISLFTIKTPTTQG